MASYFPNKTIFSISATYDSSKTITAITNANPGVATSTAHGLSDGDVGLVSSGWTDLNERAARVSGSVTNAFNLEGFNTTNTTQYPAGAGVGSFKEVLTWTALSQITDSTVQGGEQQYFQWVYLETGLQQQRPTFKNARSMTITLDYDNALAWYQKLLDHDLSGDTQILRAALPNGKFFYWSVIVGFDGEPNFNINTNMQVTATFALANPRSTKY